MYFKRRLIQYIHNKGRLHRGTVKIALWCREDDIIYLVASSVYDTKPVYYPSWTHVIPPMCLAQNMYLIEQKSMWIYRSNI